LQLTATVNPFFEKILHRGERVKRIVEFPLESGESILVEVDEPAVIDDRIGLRDQIVDKAHQTFESALDKIRPVANVILTKVRNIKEPADEVEVKFGIKISAELGAVIASGNGEVNYEITLKWNRNSDNDHTA
jgi:Trypsin-co-occurring domain 1